VVSLFYPKQSFLSHENLIDNNSLVPVLSNFNTLLTHAMSSSKEDIPSKKRAAVDSDSDYEDSKPAAKPTNRLQQKRRPQPNVKRKITTKL